MAYTDVQVPSLNDPGIHRVDNTNFITLLTQMATARDNLIQKYKDPNITSSEVQEKLVGYHLEMINLILKNSSLNEILDIYKQLHIDYKSTYMSVSQALTGLITLEDDKDATKLRNIVTLFGTATNEKKIRQTINIDTLSNLIDGENSIIEDKDPNTVISNLANYLNNIEIEE